MAMERVFMAPSLPERAPVQTQTVPLLCSVVAASF